MTKLRAVFAFLAFSLCSAIAPAQVVVDGVVIVPAGLAPGQQYRLVFGTDDEIAATSSLISTYNTFVTDQAELSAPLVSLGTTWDAVVSTATVDARDNTSTVPGTDGTGIPIYNLHGELIATSYADLWDGSIATDIRYDQFAETITGANDVWTGTNTDGTGTPGRQLGLGGTYEPMWGGRNQSDSGWIADGFPGRDSGDLQHLYAISGILVDGAAIPEPGSLALAMTLAGCCGVAARRRRRKDANG